MMMNKISIPIVSPNSEAYLRINQMPMERQSRHEEKAITLLKINNILFLFIFSVIYIVI